MICKEDFIFGLTASSNDIEFEKRRREYAKKYKRAKRNALKEFKDTPTKALLNMRYGYFRNEYSDDDEYHSREGVSDAVYEILSTREHIPNKLEGKRARQAKAKMGRHKGRRDK